MPLSPEEIERQRFSDVLRGYDKSQVESFLTAVADRYRMVAQGGPRNSGSSVGRPSAAEQGGITADDIERSHFDDALRGFDKTQVRSFLETVAGDLRRLEAPVEHLRGHHPASMDQLSKSPPGEDLGSIVRSAREIASAIRETAEREVAEMRSAAAEEAARTVETAWRELEQANATKAQAVEAAAQLRAAAEDEAARTRVAADQDAAQVRAAAEQDAAQTRRRVEQEIAGLRKAVNDLLTEAEERWVAAADELATAEALRGEAEQEATRLRAEASVDAARVREAAAGAATAAREEGERAAAEIRAQAQDQIGAAWQGLRAAQARQADEERQAAELRAVAVRETSQRLDAADRDAKAAVDAARLIATEAAGLLAGMQADLDTFRASSGHHLAEAVRKLENQIGAAVGEIHEELEQSGAQGLTMIRAVEARIRAMTDRLSAGTPPPLPADAQDAVAADPSALG